VYRARLPPRHRRFTRNTGRSVDPAGGTFGLAEKAVRGGIPGPRRSGGPAAQLLAVKPSWIYEAVRAGTLPCLRIGRHIRFTRAMLEQWLQGRLA
jgi:excisionase family DNA binding protein